MGSALSYFNKFYVQIIVSVDEKFLLKKGIRKAKESGLEINLGTKEILSIEKNKKGRIYLPSVGEDVDAKSLMAFVADDYPDVAKRYIKNKKILNSL